MDTRQNHLCAHSRATHACTYARSATCVHTHLLRVLQPIQQPVLVLVYLTVARKPYSLWTMGAKWTMIVQTQSEHKPYFVSIPASMLPQSTREKTVRQEHTATENLMRSGSGSCKSGLITHLQPHCTSIRNNNLGISLAGKSQLPLCGKVD